jgi:aryl-alcohol dehydrogenase-like predicted oxidoreductase
METRRLGKAGFAVSALSFGASSLGGVFHGVDESEAIAAVHAALDVGIDYFDVAPAYGGAKAETVLGKALRNVPRHRYRLSTKVGKYTDPDHYGEDRLDYGRDAIRASLTESATRLGVDYFDIIHIHDIEYQQRKHTEWALTEGLEAVQELKREGRIGAVSFGIYPVDLWRRILDGYPVDAALIHNHYALHDTRLLDLLPIARAHDVGVINASPFGSGLLTDRGPPGWHPATPEDRAVFQQAAALCRARGSSISKLAFQFATQNPRIPTTMFSSASAASVLRNAEWYHEPGDDALVSDVREILRPVADKDWY